MSEGRPGPEISPTASQAAATLEKPNVLHQQLPSASHETVTDQMRAQALSPAAHDLGGERSDKDIREVIQGEVVSHEPVISTEEKVVKDSARGLGRIFRWGDRKDEDQSEPEDLSTGRAGQADDETSSSGSIPTDDDHDDEETLVTAPSTGGKGPGGGTGGGGGGHEGNGGGGPENIFHPEFKDGGRNWALEYTRRAAEINGIDPVEREARWDEFLVLVSGLEKLAAGSQFFGIDRATIAQEERLDAFDKEAAERINQPEMGSDGTTIIKTVEERRDDLRSLFDQLDSLQFTQKGLVASTKIIAGEDEAKLPTGEVSKLKDRREALAETGNTLLVVQAQIINLTGEPNLLVERDERQEDIAIKIKDLKEIKKTETNYNQDLKDEEASKLELDLEARFMSEGASVIEIRFDQIPKTYKQIKEEELKDEDRLTIKALNPGDLLREITVRQLKEWYFFQARQLGLFAEVDTQLREAYTEVKEKIDDVNTNIPEGTLTRLARESSKNRIDEVEDNFAWEVDSSSLESIRDMSDEQLSSQEMRALFPKTDLQAIKAMSPEEVNNFVNLFKGTKEDFIKTGALQAGQVVKILSAIRKINIEQRTLQGNSEEITRRQGERYSQSALQQQQLEMLLERLKNTRLAGSFNVTELELILRKKAENQESARGVHPYDFQWGRYALKGFNREEIENSANAAVEDLLAGAAAFDVQTVMQRMNSLSEAVKEFGTPVGVSESEVMYLQQNVVNRISFYLGQWFGTLVQMDSYAAVAANWANQDGYERLRAIPTMVGGLAGKAIELRYSQEYALRYRLEGWAGQLYKNQLTQRFIRSNMEEMLAEDLMRYELVGGTPEKQRKTRMNLGQRNTRESFDSSFKITEHPREAVITAKREYDRLLRGLERTPLGELTVQDLVLIKKQRTAYNKIQREYNRRRRDAKAAAEFSGQVMDFFLESAYRGAPSIRMNNRLDPHGKPQKFEVNGRKMEIKGDDISIEDITLILEHVVMQEAKETSKALREAGYRFAEDGSFIRWRMRMFLASVMSPDKTLDQELNDKLAFKVRKVVKDSRGNIVIENGREKTEVVTLVRSEGAKGAHQPSEGEVNPPPLVVAPGGFLDLQPGFEYTGLTQREFKKLVEAFQKLKKGGYQTKLNGKSVPEILKEMQNLSPVLNNYVGEDIQGSDYFFHNLLKKMAEKGQQPFVANVQNRLKWFGVDNVLEKLPFLTVTGQREELTMVLENSRSFHDTVNGLVLYLGTRKEVSQVLEPKYYRKVIRNTSLSGEHGHGGYGEEDKHRFGVNGIYVDLTDFNADDVIFGFPNITLGHKRIAYLPENWLLRNQERVARGLKLVPHLTRIMMPPLSKDLAAKDLLEGIWNMDKDFFDLPWLQGWAKRTKNAVEFRKLGETSIGEDHKLKWGYLDKWLSDIEQVWQLFEEYEHGGKQLSYEEPMNYKTREGTIATVESVFTRFVPLLNVIAESVSYDREGGGSGAAYETQLKMLLHMLGWLLDSKTKDKGSRQLEGGAFAHGDGITFNNFMIEAMSYRQPGIGLPELAHWSNKSIIQRVWERIRDRTPNISSAAPLPRAEAD